MVIGEVNLGNAVTMLIVLIVAFGNGLFMRRVDRQLARIIGMVDILNQTTSDMLLHLKQEYRVRLRVAEDREAQERQATP